MSNPMVDADLREFIDRVIVPALLERFLCEQQAPTSLTPRVLSPLPLPSPEPRA